jgi:23S rRNA pseudouridine2605 synthase
MSTKIFVVLLTGVSADSKQRPIYNQSVRGRARKAKHTGPGKGHVGLARALSKMGFCSRSQAFELVRAGRVRLKGVLTKDPEAPVRRGKDAIEIDGAPVRSAEKVYWVLNKPRSLVTTAEDQQGRETVYAKLPKGLPWMSPVGRLDKASEGLLLFTNDSEWAARITSPESHLDKTYHVQIAAVAHEKLLRTLERGLTVESGEILRVKCAKKIREGEKNSWIEIVLDEGKNRQIRRMLEGLGVETLRLVRVAVGPLKLGDLAKGEARTLTAAEKIGLDRAPRASLQRTSAARTGNPP